MLQVFQLSVLQVFNLDVAKVDLVFVGAGPTGNPARKGEDLV